jgi:hypothetical protein
MKKKFLEHGFSIAFVSIIFLILIIHFHSSVKEVQSRRDAEIESFLALHFIDFDNPLHKSLLKETLDMFYPAAAARNDSLMRAIEQYRRAQIAKLQQNSGLQSGLSGSKFTRLLGMYVSFIFAYLLVMSLTYYGVLTLATQQFIREKQGKTSYLAELVEFLQRLPRPQSYREFGRIIGHSLALVAKAILRGAGYFLAFSPAYVIAYSFKTRFDTDTFFFMVLLGVISNGLLITYAQKFYTFLIAESRKGYVQTAIVKNLNNDYSPSVEEGISRKAIFRLRKEFPGHVFQHIFLNARYQYISTLKEQASFLITGLVIIEMALNIQGHLCYELLQNILYKKFDVALTIIWGIFLVVKVTEMFTDYWQNREMLKYANG